MSGHTDGYVRFWDVSAGLLEPLNVRVRGLHEDESCSAVKLVHMDEVLCAWACETGEILLGTLSSVQQQPTNPFLNHYSCDVTAADEGIDNEGLNNPGIALGNNPGIALGNNPGIALGNNPGIALGNEGCKDNVDDDVTADLRSAAVQSSTDTQATDTTDKPQATDTTDKPDDCQSPRDGADQLPSTNQLPVLKVRCCRHATAELYLGLICRTM